MVARAYSFLHVQMIHQTEDVYILLTKDKLDISFGYDWVVLPWTGGISSFIGTTRNSFGNKRVKTLFYEAYEPMAIKQIVKICNCMKQNFSGGRICIMHRLDEVRVKEASIVIFVSSEHRAAAIDATTFAINEIKARVPIWKKEIYEDDEETWKENKEVFWKNDEK